MSKRHNDSFDPSRRRLLKLGGLALGGAALDLAGCGGPGHVEAPAVADVPRQGGLDSTFFLVADTHFGYVDDAGRDIESLNARLVENLNKLPGQAYPDIYGGSVADPWGVVVAGDLTEDGEEQEWDTYAKYFGLMGEGELHFPVHECVGNHDRHAGDFVTMQVIKRQGARRYVLEQGDLAVINLGEFPGDDDLDWLRAELARIGRERPVIVYLHYSLVGPYSHPDWVRKWKLLYVLHDFNIVGLFHGHFHGSGMYDWFGIDVYNVGASKHGSNSFAVIRVTDERMTVSEWNWGFGDWWWTHSKPINRQQGEEHLEIFPSLQGWRDPVIPYPKTRRRPGRR